MTQEEVIKILEILHQRMDYPTKEALAIAIDYLSQPPLPSNLDEAAFEYENELWESGYKNCGYSPQEVNDAFKAGANWREAQIPKLPDNVDEAADTFAHSGDVNGVGGDDYEDDLRITFKAGAEWMAGQGVSIKWHNATEIPSPDIEVIAEVKGFKHARFCVLKHTEEGWWQHIPKVFDQMPCDGWVGTGDVRVIRWKYIEDD